LKRPGGRAKNAVTIERGQGGPRDFFWGSLAPLSVFSAFGLTMLTLVFVVWTADVTTEQILILAVILFATSLGFLLPAELYIVATRLERPLRRLEVELTGGAPWRPEGDVLFAPVRRAAEQVRDSAREARDALAWEQQRVRNLQDRLEGRGASGEFAVHAASVLRPVGGVEQFALVSAHLFGEVWPAENVLLLVQDVVEGELEVICHVRDGEIVPPDPSAQAAGRYRRASLPAPLKEAQRRGFFAEAGLPFSHDPAIPDARSFVAMALDHRGVGDGYLFASSTVLVPPDVEPIRRASDVFSITFSRVMYARETEDAAIRDTLTGLYRYDHFLTVTRQEVARANRYSRPVGCLMVDVDGLRRINDSYGSGGGDRTIAEVGEIARRLLRSSDMVARLSGGRLAILLPESDEEACLTVAERILATVADHAFILQRGSVERLTVTVGVAVHPPFGVTAMALVDAAHAALLDAKAAGRNRYALAGSATLDSRLDTLGTCGEGGGTGTDAAAAEG
jgi:diguanylate cyclase (GGDEF)-like protein